MDQAITRATGATPSTTSQAAAPRLVGEFQGYFNGVEPSVVWADRKNMPEVGSKLYSLAPGATMPRTWSLLLVGENYGHVGPAGSQFSHAGERHERVQVVEVVAAGAPPAPDVDLAGLVWLDAAELMGQLDEVYAWARELPISTRGTISAMQKVRTVKEALAAAPSAPVEASVDTPEFRALADRWQLCLTTDISTVYAQLIAHIDQHVASQVQAARGAALEDAAKLVDAALEGSLRSTTAAAIRALRFNQEEGGE